MIALAVDDDVVSRMALVDLLAHFPMLTVEEAEDGEAAWQRLQSAPCPVLCCCDIRMPWLSGMGLLARLKASPRLAELPLVLVSSAADRLTVQEAIRLGAAGYILKPFKVSEARPKLDAVLQQTLARLAEKPRETARRLNVSPERLQAYWTAFQGQLSQAAQEMDQIASHAGTWHGRLDSLHTGCVTLGLWRGAALLDHLRQGMPDAASARQILMDVHGLVAQQFTLLKHHSQAL